MKEQFEPNKDSSDNETRKSCPAVIEEDITKSINEQSFGRNVRSQQFLPQYEDDSILEDQDTSKKESRASGPRSSSLNQRPQPQSKADPRTINQKGTDFDCQKVQSIELSMDEASYRSGSLKNRSNKNSQQQLQEPRSGKKVKRQENEKPFRFESYRQSEIKQEVLNVFLAGAQDTGKSRFRQCFKGRQRKSEELYIKKRTRQIIYEKMEDQNLLNKRNSVCFIDIPGFMSNQQDKYLREITQYATTQWHNFLIRPEDDKRIHCCLYFLRGPRIKQSGINMIKKLSQMFNLIPVIAKSDHYKKQQILEMKDEFNRKISAAGQIELYDLEQFYLMKLGTERIKQAMYSNFGKIPPFAIASSTDHENSQSPEFVRKYPWGKVQIQNEQHTDFKRLTDLLTSDVRAQFLAKIIPLPRDNEFEIVEQEIGQIRGQINPIEKIRAQNNENTQFYVKIKNLAVVSALVVAIGLCFSSRIRKMIQFEAKSN